MEDDDVAIVKEEGPRRGKIAGVEVRERVIIKFILVRQHSVDQGDLEDVRDGSVGMAAAGRGGHGGTVVFTGTPAGVGLGLKPPVFLKKGDVVRIEIDGIGTLQNAFV